MGDQDQSVLTAKFMGSCKVMMSFLVNESSVRRSFQYFCLMFSSSMACNHAFHSCIIKV